MSSLSLSLSLSLSGVYPFPIYIQNHIKRPPLQGHGKHLALVLGHQSPSKGRQGLACLKHSRTMGDSPESHFLARGSTDISRHPNRPRRPRRAMSQVEKGVQALRRLVPNGESMELHGLFREATDYIACLQAQIKAMQIMVEVLSESSGKLPSAEKIRQRPQE